MGKTIKQILDRAYFKNGIKQEGIDLTQSEYDAGIEEYNALIYQDWADGLNYECAEVSNQTDDTSLPVWANSYMENTLALRLGAEFNAPIPAALPAMAEQALRAVEKIAVRIPTPYRTSILPTGGGENGFWSRQKFFGRQEADDLVDGNGSKIRNEEDEVLENEVEVRSIIGDTLN